jgi:O-antigen/teichoic acid export membrane protein
MTALLVIFGGVVPKYPLLVCLLFALPSMIIAPLLRLKVPLKDADQNTTTDTPNPWKAHWSYGRWASIGGLCSAVTAPIYFFVLPLDGCAAYRAIMNVPMPLLQTYTALGPAFIALFTPLRGKSQLVRAVTQSLIVVSTAALALGLAVSVYSGNILRILYSDKYTGYSGQLRPLMIYSCLVSVTVVLDSAMRSMGKVRIATLASLTAVVVSFAVGIPAAIRFGVQGAGYGLVASQASALGVLGVVWLRTHVVRASPMRLTSSSTLSSLGESRRIEDLT